ncbi:very short patch repair endonuclease [Bradyrhizobium sp.]|uniref:very short patch repair endonuclease n=1 Tax=Bradyrhizobium sp. TaxID=376 RepID=UPI002601E67B|nr:very short patch repair endonuclease [Bradyrhizobium sp.]
MADTRTPAQRRRIMQSVGTKNTLPEKTVRRIIHALGFRFRLHRRDLPGTPDIVLPRLRKVVFVNGCFWHGHRNCKKGALPKSRPEYWGPKIARNIQRDVEVRAKLKAAGWDALTVWQCETANPDRVRRRLKDFL